MYSFVLRAHQKIDRTAFRDLTKLLGHRPPITSKDILHFEGRRGPDAARLKRGNNEPPWHFYRPNGGNNGPFLATLQAHHNRLTESLRTGNSLRAAFEAAWLAHAIVDGLTPAHHYPYEEELAKLRQEEKETRASVGKYFFVRTGSSGETVKRSIKLIGPKGLLTTHTTFEAGAAMIILPLKLTKAMPSAEDLTVLSEISFVGVFEQYVRQIEQLKIYDRFYKRGWTERLARDIRRELAPRMVRAVTLAWFSAHQQAGIPQENSNAD